MNGTKTGYVYTLADPRTGEPRYVGATKRPKARLNDHIQRAHNEGVSEWVDELESAGVEPEMQIVDVAAVNELSVKERRAIERLSERFELFNDPSASGYNDELQPDDRDLDVLRVLDGGRANPYLIREETCLDKGDVNTVLNRLARGGYVEQVTRGLYEMTASGERRVRDKVNDE